MYLKDIIPERMFEDTDFDYKATLQDGNPMKWAKSIVAFANGDGLSLPMEMRCSLMTFLPNLSGSESANSPGSVRNVSLVKRGKE